jgi:FkbH-like protein
MKLIEALKIVQKPLPDDAESFQLFLACGCTPLHLQTFLSAHLLRHQQRRIVIQTGLYGDLLGNLARLAKMTVDAGAVVLEWADFDPRLGLRHLGGWGPEHLSDIFETVRAHTTQLQEAIERASEHVSLTLCLPTLPLPPIAFTPSRQASTFELQLRECVSVFAARVAAMVNVRLVNPQRLDRLSPPGDRLDVQSELRFGFPYSITHASAIAELLADLIFPKLPKKGLITDLDDTLWRGILGEVGVEGISWDLDHHSHVHRLYQQLLGALASAGTLLAVASKNDSTLVEEAFHREELTPLKERFFPMEVHWGPKSTSIGRILQKWNIGLDSVIFVDDSPMELAEVQAAYPEVECLLFPTEDDQAVYDLLEYLRDLFGKEVILEEDTIRAESLRRTHSLYEDAAVCGVSLDHFLAQAEAELTVTFCKTPPDPRALELINKTNQFNLNGKRFLDSTWRAHLHDPDTFLCMVAYKDKYGPLGKIAVLTGRTNGKTLCIDTWVMSCRAFARRIEHQCLALLFDKFHTEDISFDFQATPRNAPLQDFFGELLDVQQQLELRLSKEVFVQKCPPLFHQVKEVTHV